jgi:hypothetical protein
MQDAVAIAVALVAAAWLGWSLVARCLTPSCGPPTNTPAGSDGFVPLDALRGPEKKPGRSRERPGS